MSPLSEQTETEIGLESWFHLTLAGFSKLLNTAIEKTCRAEDLPSKRSKGQNSQRHYAIHPGWGETF